MTEDNGKKLTLSGKSTLTLKKTNMTLKPEGKKVVQVEVRKKRFVNPQTQSKPAVEIDETLAQKLELLAKAKEHEAKRKQEEEEKAVKCGYWHLWRYNPALEEEGKNPFQLDSKEPNWEDFQGFLKGEVRYASVMKQYPAEAEELFKAAEENAKWRYNSYKRLARENWGAE